MYLFGDKFHAGERCQASCTGGWNLLPTGDVQHRQKQYKLPPKALSRIKVYLWPIKSLASSLRWPTRENSDNCDDGSGAMDTRLLESGLSTTNSFHISYISGGEGPLTWDRYKPAT